MSVRSAGSHGAVRRTPPAVRAERLQAWQGFHKWQNGVLNIRRQCPASVLRYVNAALSLLKLEVVLVHGTLPVPVERADVTYADLGNYVVDVTPRPDKCYATVDAMVVVGRYRQ